MRIEIFTIILAAIVFAVCQSNVESESVEDMKIFSQDTKVADVINYKNFSGFGKLIFPVNRGIEKNLMLKNLDEVLIWYSHVNSAKTVEIVNYFKEKSDAGEKIFYDIYSDAEKNSDSRKRFTGLFFFRGKPNEKFAICNAGGGFYYVGAMHDSFPHALELSKRGYNAFALIYRPDAQLACEDLARAIFFVHEHAAELQVDVKNYSLWGGSAGARMAAWLGSFGTENFGEKNIRALRQSLCSTRDFPKFTAMSRQLTTASALMTELRIGELCNVELKISVQTVRPRRLKFLMDCRTVSDSVKELLPKVGLTTRLIFGRINFKENF